jgi:multicomponent K+:H+ antiporter subunit E
MRRWLPFPLLTVSLLALWLLLTGSLAPGTIILGGVLAIGAAQALTALTPPKTRLQRPRAVFRLALVVLAEIARSNWAAARIILLPGTRQRRSGFVRIPLDSAFPTDWRRWPVSSWPRPVPSGWSTIPLTTPCFCTFST